MRTLPLFVASAALVLAFAVAATAQQGSTNPGRGGDNGRDGNPTDCTSLCVPVRAGAADKFDACGDKLDKLRPVTAHQVAAVHSEAKVRLVPLCDTANRSLTETQSRQLERGNIEGLLPTIAGNAAMADRLAKGGYRIDDVLGIAMAPQLTLLYVSHR